MISKLKLKNFRKHRDLTISFDAGLNVLRGANEQGKSTIIEAVLYALFGSKTLRTPLVEAVTWGEKESTLGVELEIVVEGKRYFFKRSKSGATASSSDFKDGVAVGGIIVTGQGEVTDFASNLLGADAKTAAMLMLSSQSGLRGALDDGPAAVSALMGRLADFDLIDRIVESAQANLMLGSDVQLRERLAVVKSEVEALVDPGEHAWEIHEQYRAATQLQVNEAEQRLVSVLEPAWRQALQALNAAVASNTARQVLASNIDTLLSSMASTNNQLAEATRRAVRVPAADLEAARKAVEAFKNRQELSDVRDAVQKLGTYPEVFWEGDVATFDTELAEARSRLSDAEAAVKEATTKIVMLRKQIIVGGKCPTCGHDAKNDDHVKAANDAVNAEIATWDDHAKQHGEKVTTARQDVAALEAVAKAAKSWMTVATRYEGRQDVKIERSVYPPRVAWVGSIGEADPEAEKKLKKLEDADRNAVRAEGEVSTLKARLQELGVQKDKLHDQYVAHEIIDTAPLQAASDAAYAEYTKVQADITIANAVVATHAAARDKARQDYQDFVSKKASLLWKAVELESDIDRINFNNTLLKKLKTVKPLITDHLWNTVLSAVSSFFSKLRGETSMVTKDAAGFKVNGQNVESLSGSTLDVLALAIRVALTKTFIPHSSFIVLDEPAHGCDSTRTGNVLGFLSSVGFSQTLLASHDELSEAVADRIISLESA